MEYLLLIIIMIIGCCLAYDAFIREPRQLITRKMTIETKTAKDFHIAFFSDIHFTTYNFPYRSSNIINKLQEMKPDIIIFGGDLIDKQWEDTAFLLDLKVFLKSLQAPYGVYFVCGNHDASYISHETYHSFMKSCGIHALNNETVAIHDLDVLIGGCEDALFGKPVTSLIEARTHATQILISHEPDVLDKMNLKHIDIALSGHTHGGQIRIPYLYKLVLPTLGRRYIKGKYNIQNTTLIVSSGIGGALFSARFLNPPEIIDIHCKQRSQ